MLEIENGSVCEEGTAWLEHGMQPGVKSLEDPSMDWTSVQDPGMDDPGVVAQKD